MDKKPGPPRIPAAEQPHDRYYDMSIKFAATISVRELEHVFPQMGMQAVLTDAVTLRVAQCIPFIPDDGMLAKYGDALKESYNRNSGKVSITDIRFDGYDYLYAVNFPEEPTCT